MRARAQILADEVKMQLRYSLCVKTTTEVPFVNNLWQKQVETFLRLRAYFKWNFQNLWTIISILKHKALKTAEFGINKMVRLAEITAGRTDNSKKFEQTTVWYVVDNKFIIS